MNHEHYNERLEFIRRTLKDVFGLHLKVIIPIAYDRSCPFPYNNFIYKIEISPFQHQQDRGGEQPGTEDIPTGTKQLVMRLANAAAKLNDQNRVQNEVAALAIARSALRPKKLVPAVYAWGTAAESQGWILMEFMNGLPLDEYISELTDDDKQKREIIGQVASVLSAFQEFQLPSTIRGFGGLSFNDQGDIISGPLTTSQCGPFDTYLAMMKAVFREKLLHSDSNSNVDGWRIDGLRSRIEAYITHDLEHMIDHLKCAEKRFIHGDFS